MERISIKVKRWIKKLVRKGNSNKAIEKKVIKYHLNFVDYKQVIEKERKKLKLA